jgi:hypothetical protein
MIHVQANRFSKPRVVLRAIIQMNRLLAKRNLKTDANMRAKGVSKTQSCKRVTDLLKTFAEARATDIAKNQEPDASH